MKTVGTGWVYMSRTSCMLSYILFSIGTVLYTLIDETFHLYAWIVIGAILFLAGSTTNLKKMTLPGMFASVAIGAMMMVLVEFADVMMVLFVTGITLVMAFITVLNESGVTTALFVETLAAMLIPIIIFAPSLSIIDGIMLVLVFLMFIKMNLRDYYSRPWAYNLADFALIFMDILLIVGGPW